MCRYVCVVFCLVLISISYDTRVAETEGDLAQAVEDLKAQVNALSEANARLNLQIKDLYFMTEPLRIRVVDADEGSYYHARRRVDTRGTKMWGMLPSELAHAKLYYQIRRAGEFGHSKEKIKELIDKLMQMPTNPYLNPYKPYYNFFEEWLIHHPNHPDRHTYFLAVPFVE